jgi:hypothetical protein
MSLSDLGTNLCISVFSATMLRFENIECFSGKSVRVPVGSEQASEYSFSSTWVI